MGRAVMRTIILTAALIIGVMLAASCASSPRNVDKQHDDLYDTDTALDLTGAVKYTVKWGDTLSKISRRFYNDGFYYPVIMLASRGIVKNPDKIWPGMALTIPDLEKNKASVNYRKTIKNCLNEFADLERNKPRPRRGLIDGLKKRADAL
jgi:hypothetical protein